VVVHFVRKISVVPSSLEWENRTGIFLSQVWLSHGQFLF
jgi:hypothetical protein